LERQQLVQEEWIRLAESTGPALQTALLRIDPRMGLIEQDYETTATTQDGRMVAPYSGTPDYGGRDATELPNFSDDMTVFVLFDLGSGVVPSVNDRRKMAQAERLLRAVLGAWVSFDLVFARGFVLDQSLMGRTSYGA
jgi:hypothetical protein